MKNVYSKSNILGISLAVILAGSSVAALAGPHCKDQEREHGLERMIKHLDLSDAQKAKVESIMASAEKDRSDKKGMPKMRALMSLNPDDADYLQQVEAQAESASKDMKAHIIKMAKVRQEINAVLTDEQKQEMKELMQKKMHRMEKNHED